MLLCVGCYDGKVYVIERSSGIIKWSFQTEGPVKSSACVNPCNGYTYIGSHDHHVYAFNIKVKVRNVQPEAQLLLRNRASAMHFFVVKLLSITEMTYSCVCHLRNLRTMIQLICYAVSE